MKIIRALIFQVRHKNLTAFISDPYYHIELDTLDMGFQFQLTIKQGEL